MKKHILLTALALSASVSLIIAQDAKPAGGGPPPQGGQGGGPGGRGGAPGGGQAGPGGGGQRPVSPMIEALDAHKDGIIDADELAKATESLKKLDKNGDRKLTEDEYRPQRPGGQGGPGAGGPGAAGGRPGGQGGPGTGAGRGGAQGGPPGAAPGAPQRPPLEK